MLITVHHHNNNNYSYSYYHKLKRTRLLASRNLRKIHRNRIIFIVALIFSSHHPLLLCVFLSHIVLFPLQNRTNVACCVIVCVRPAPFTSSILPHPPPSLCVSQVISPFLLFSLSSFSIYQHLYKVSHSQLTEYLFFSSLSFYFSSSRNIRASLSH